MLYTNALSRFTHIGVFWQAIEDAKTLEQRQKIQADLDMSCFTTTPSVALQTHNLSRFTSTNPQSLYKQAIEDAKALVQRQKIQADLDLITTIDQKAREISTQGGAKVASPSLTMNVDREC